MGIDDSFVYRISKSNLLSRRRHRIKRPDGSDIVKSQRSAARSVITVNISPCIYGRKVLSAQTKSRHSFYLVEYFFSAGTSEGDQNPIGYLVLEDSTWKAAAPIEHLHFLFQRMDVPATECRLVQTAAKSALIFRRLLLHHAEDL